MKNIVKFLICSSILLWANNNIIDYFFIINEILYQNSLVNRITIMISCLIFYGIGFYKILNLTINNNYRTVDESGEFLKDKSTE